MSHRPFRWFVALAALLLSAFAFAQGAPSAGGEPTLSQIYQAAHTGDTARAQRLIDQVLQSHPNSAKAHYVKAELSAQQRDYAAARQELATAERLSPGLSFVKPEAVQALRRQIAEPGVASPARGNDTRRMGAAPGDAPARDSRGGGMPWGTLAILGVIVAAAIAMMRRRRAAEPQGGVMPSAPFDRGGMPQGYGPNAYGPNAYGPAPGNPQQPSMGSSIMRGLGTGLAVGAGAVAANELGRRMFERDHPGGSGALGSTTDPAAIDAGMNTDMGGNDFGIADGGNWDDAGGGSFGGLDDGGDWNG